MPRGAELCLHVVQVISSVKAMPVPRKAHYCKHNLDDRRPAPLGEREPRRGPKGLGDIKSHEGVIPIDVYSRACTHSSVGREISCDGAARRSQPLRRSSHAAPADGFELFDGEHGPEAGFYVAELPFFVRISNKRTAWEES